MPGDRWGVAGRITRSEGFTVVEVAASDPTTRYAIRATIHTACMYEPRKMTSFVMLSMMTELKKSLDGTA